MNTHAFNFPDRVRYFLWHQPTNRKELIYDPRGWDDDDKTLSRDKTYYGILRKTADDLVFTKGKKIIEGKEIYGGYDFIKDIKKIGLNETILIIREERNGKTNSWEEAYRSELDLLTDKETTSKEGDYGRSLKSSDAGLDSIIKARKDEEMEITRRFAIDDEKEENELPEMPFHLVELKGRKIEFLNNQTNEYSEYNFAQNVGTPVMDLKFASSDGFLAVTSFDDSPTGANNLFFYNNRGETISGQVVTVKGVFKNETGLSITIDIYINTIQNNGGVYSKVRQVQPFSDTIQAGGTSVFNFQFIDSFSLPNQHGYSFSIAKSPVNMVIEDLSLSMVESNEQEPTTTKAYRLKDTIERYLLLMTGKSNILKSDFIDSIGSNMFITDGALVRNIPVTSTNTNTRTHQLETSFKDIFDSFDASWNLSVGVEKEGFKEYVRIEQKEYFFNTNVVLDLGELTDISRTTASEFVYSGTNIGYDGEAKIEGIQGLDKTNGAANRITTITRQEKVYEKISKFQTDDYPREVQRRKQFGESPTEDVKYDDTKMILDCQKAVADISLKILDNDLHQKGVILNVPTISSNNLFFQFSTTPAANAILIGVDEEETIQNAYTYLTEVDFYKDYFDYTIFGYTITGVCKLEWRWVELTAENLGNSVEYGINNYGTDQSDRTYRQRTVSDDFIDSNYCEFNFTSNDMDEFVFRLEVPPQLGIPFSTRSEYWVIAVFTTGTPSATNEVQLGADIKETVENFKAWVDVQFSGKYTSEIISYNTIRLTYSINEFSMEFYLVDGGNMLSDLITSRLNVVDETTGVSGVYDIEGLTNGRWTPY